MIKITAPLDLTNQKFEYCTVIKRVENSKAGKSRWLCKCVCGKEFVAVGSQLVNTRTKHCGCMESTLRALSKIKIIDIGERFGNLVVVEYLGVTNSKSTYRCLCDCGNEVVVTGNRLQSGNTKSCGCLQRLGASKSLKERWDNGVQLRSIHNSINHSKPEAHIVDLIKNKYNVLEIKELFGYFPDCIVEINGQLFDVEYDGYHWHTTPKSIIHDNIRNQVFNDNGYKVIRFLCPDRYTLSAEDIDEAFNYMLSHDDKIMIFNKMNK